MSSRTGNNLNYSSDVSDVDVQRLSSSIRGLRRILLSFVQREGNVLLLRFLVHSPMGCLGSFMSTPWRLVTLGDLLVQTVSYTTKMRISVLCLGHFLSNATF